MRVIARRTDRQIDRQTDRQTDRNFLFHFKLFFLPFLFSSLPPLSPPPFPTLFHHTRMHVIYTRYQRDKHHSLCMIRHDTLCVYYGQSLPDQTAFSTSYTTKKKKEEELEHVTKQVQLILESVSNRVTMTAACNDGDARMTRSTDKETDQIAGLFQRILNDETAIELVDDSEADVQPNTSESSRGQGACESPLPPTPPSPPKPRSPTPPPPPVKARWKTGQKRQKSTRGLNRGVDSRVRRVIKHLVDRRGGGSSSNGVKSTHQSNKRKRIAKALAFILDEAKESRRPEKKKKKKPLENNDNDSRDSDEVKDEDDEDDDV